MDFLYPQKFQDLVTQLRTNNQLNTRKYKNLEREINRQVTVYICIAFFIILTSGIAYFNPNDELVEDVARGVIAFSIAAMIGANKNEKALYQATIVAVILIVAFIAIAQIPINFFVLFLLVIWVGIFIHALFDETKKLCMTYAYLATAGAVSKAEIIDCKRRSTSMFVPRAASWSFEYEFEDLKGEAHTKEVVIPFALNDKHYIEGNKIEVIYEVDNPENSLPKLPFLMSKYNLKELDED